MTSPNRTRPVYWITLALVGLAMAGLLALLPHAGSDLRWTIHWLPGTGAMNVGLGETGVYATLITAGACLLALAAARAVLAPATGALVLLALWGGAGAFLAEHFLLRYVALELVALCVALAPLAEREEDTDGTARGRWARLVYLVLRVGDAGLLVGIAALWSATDTLEISPALKAGQSLTPALLNWIVGGLLLAVWVKVGGWPLHVWQQAGKTLSRFSSSWLYGTLTPNLGLYLLYRITPLIARTPAIEAGALWGGALFGFWSAVLALGTLLADRTHARSERPSRPTILHYAAQGALALVLAAMNLKTAVWLTVIALTPLRVLLALAEDAAHEARQARGRELASALFGLGGLALTSLNALCLWWAREAGLPLSVRWIVEGMVGLLAARVTIATIGLWRGDTQESTKARSPRRATAPTAVRRWIVLALLACGLLAASLWHAPLLEHLAYAASGAPFVLPTLSATMRFLVTSPAGLLVFALALWAQRSIRSGALPRGIRPSGREQSPALALEQSIRQAARAIHGVVEIGTLSKAMTGIGQGVLGIARLAHQWIEGAFLEGATRQIAQTSINGGRLAHRWIEGALEENAQQLAQTTTDGEQPAYQVIEQSGLEGLLRWVVRAVMASSRWLQRRHTGRLRRNLIWVAASLALAVLGLILYAW